jgi:predicted nucleotidyltransferase/uncharacterized protein (UPF0332 family)
MVKKKKSSGKKQVKKKTIAKTRKKKSKKDSKKIDLRKVPTLQLSTENEIAMDFASRVYKKFNKIIKSVVLFGSSAKQSAVAGSDVDIVIILDDVSIKWDQELVAWYRQELDKILSSTPYQKNLHINTITLSTWWDDLMKGDPVVMNIVRYGEPLLDFAGFFEPIKYLLIKGKIRPAPEAIYNCLERAPQHLFKSKQQELGTIESLYWAMVDSAHAALMAEGLAPPSPEHLGVDLKEVFVNSKRLKMQYVLWFRDLLILHKKIVHGEIRELRGVEIDAWQERTQDFINTMTKLVKEIIERK